MELTSFTFKIILLFLPGFIAFRIVDRLTAHKEYKFYQAMLYSLMYGLLCYGAYYPFTFIPCPDLKSVFWNNLNGSTAEISLIESLGATILSYPVAFIITALINYSALFWLARKCRVSKRFGDPDVWSYVLNSGEETIWVVIRDIQNDLMYEGWIQAFSEGLEGYEVFMRDVKVFKHTTGEELYITPATYLYSERKSFVAEFPMMLYSKHIERKESNNESR